MEGAEYMDIRKRLKIFVIICFCIVFLILSQTVIEWNCNKTIPTILEADSESLSRENNIIRQSSINYSKGIMRFQADQYLSAIDKFRMVSAQDERHYQYAQEKIMDCRQELIKEAKNLKYYGKYNQAYVRLIELRKKFPADLKIHELLEIYKKDIVVDRYEGAVEHIFFHSLVIYPELAFDGDSMSEGYENWMVTVSEFKKILEALYKRNYILISIEDLYKMDQDNSTIQKKELFLPKGKRPLILSIDDANYYEYMKDDGFAKKLIIDDNHNVTALVKGLNGRFEERRDGDVVPIVDDFIRQHPDFSFRGARGIIGVTGYEGILGYRTNDQDSSTYEEDLQKVKEVVQQLKETGWIFASHSYSHRDLKKMGVKFVQEDTRLWKEQIQSIIGSSNIYIFPFGSRVSQGDDRYQVLVNGGFRVFCGVGGHPYLQYDVNGLFMDRKHIDGYALKHQRALLKDLFDVESIIDKRRQP